MEFVAAVTLRRGASAHNIVTNTTVVILGATGDLTRRLLMPALYRLSCTGHLESTSILGYAMENWSRGQFLAHIEESLRQFVREVTPEPWARFAKRLDYRSGDLTADRLTTLTGVVPASALFYLALPPQLFGPAAEALGQAGLARADTGWRRLVVEKPFGADLASAEALREQIHRAWPESQVYRIDHFLGKETTQNLLVFRFANRFLEPVWNAHHVAQVQITVAETLGLEGRWRYYEQAGALRDMLQNHLMQLFALTAMEPPSTWDAEVLREHKVDVLRSVRPIPPDRVDEVAVRGQYTAGRVNGRPVPGYLEEEGVARQSRTETFAALRLEVDSWRWRGVPFYLRSGKRLRADWSEIAVQFRPVPGQPLAGDGGGSNWLIFRLRPEEAIDLVAVAKKPGLGLEGRRVVLSTPYTREGEPESSAYEQLLLDALSGDRAHFLRFDEVEWAWRILDPVLRAWRRGRPDAYAAGSDGPAPQARLLEPGLAWRPLADA